MRTRLRLLSVRRARVPSLRPLSALPTMLIATLVGGGWNSLPAGRTST